MQHMTAIVKLVMSVIVSQLARTSLLILPYLEASLMLQFDGKVIHRSQIC